MRHACSIFYLSGLRGLVRLREMGAVGMNGGICRPFLAAGFSPGISAPSSGDIWVSPPGKERLGAFLPLLFTRLLRWQPGFGLGGTFKSGSILLSVRRSHPGTVWVYSYYSAFSWVLASHALRKAFSALVYPLWCWLGRVPGTEEKSLPSPLSFRSGFKEALFYHSYRASQRLPVTDQTRQFWWGICT